MRPIHIFLLLSAVALLVGLYKIFEKAGEKGWKAFVPVYNFIVWLRIIQKPWWWIFLILIPTVGFYMLAIMIVLTSNCFGKTKWSDHIIAIVAYFVWVPNLGFSKNIKWQGVPAPEKKKHWAKEWGEAGIFAIIAATLIRTFFFEAFVIPSSSMESTLLVGDYLFVSKMSYGAKIPEIPLTIPFTHNTIPGTDNAVSYLDWIQLPYMRLPGFGSVQRNDIVVFYFPEGDTVYSGNRNESYYGYLRNKSAQSGISTDEERKILIDNDSIVLHPVDKEDNYVKRCVAIAGDVLEYRDKVLYINKSAAMVPQNAQWSWDFNAPINSGDDYKQWFNKFTSAGIIDNANDGFGFSVADTSFRFSIPVNASKLEAFKSIVGNTKPSLTPKGFFDPNDPLGVFPHDTIHFKWNRDNFGPLQVPKKGMTVNIDTTNISLYKRVIQVYEGNELQVKEGKILINGKVATSYTFQQDYFFMSGDNRHNSLDSRYWGFVPEDHIVGKPVFVWMSKGDFAGFRPDRMMCFVTKDGLSKSYLWWVIGGIILLVVYGQVKNRMKENKKPVAASSKKK